jgi:hypothetical protein
VDDRPTHPRRRGARGLPPPRCRPTTTPVRSTPRARGRAAVPGPRPARRAREPSEFGAIPVVDPMTSRRPTTRQPSLTRPPATMVTDAAPLDRSAHRRGAEASSARRRRRAGAVGNGQLVPAALARPVQRLGRPDLADLGDDLPRIGLRDDSAASDDFFTFDDSEAGSRGYGPAIPPIPTGTAAPTPTRRGGQRSSERGPQHGCRRRGRGGVRRGRAGPVEHRPRGDHGLVVVVLVLASAEMMSTLRRVGYAPPALVGLAAGGDPALAAYWRGESGHVLGVGARRVRVPALVRARHRHRARRAQHRCHRAHRRLRGGVRVLRRPDAALAARHRAAHRRVLGPIFYDIAGLFIGRSMGRSPLSTRQPQQDGRGHHRWDGGGVPRHLDRRRRRHRQGHHPVQQRGRRARPRTGPGAARSPRPTCASRCSSATSGSRTWAPSSPVTAGCSTASTPSSSRCPPPTTWRSSSSDLGAGQ